MAETGGIITLGSYPQNSTAFSSKEPIRWIILAKEEGRKLCISDCKPYHRAPEMVTWASCTLREWLNHDFFQAAFSPEEQQRILPTCLTNHREYPQHSTTDKIFLLDYQQAVDYFEAEDHPITRSALTTPYARSQGGWFLSEEEAGDDEAELAWAGTWWLRCPAVIPTKNPDGLFDVQSCVNYDDYIELYAAGVEETDVCVRPALWLKDS